MKKIIKKKRDPEMWDEAFLKVKGLKLHKKICDTVSYKIVDGDTDGSFIFLLTFYENRQGKKVPIKTIKMHHRFEFKTANYEDNFHDDDGIISGIFLDMSDALDMLRSPEMAKEIIEENLQLEIRKKKLSVTIYKKKGRAIFLMVSSPTIKGGYVSERIDIEKVKDIIQLNSSKKASLDDEEEFYDEEDED